MKTTTGREIRIKRFVSRETAFNSLENCEKASAVMLGDDERYWVVTMADAARLERMGYEWAR
jgi:hypothetical protein